MTTTTPKAATPRPWRTPTETEGFKLLVKHLVEAYRAANISYLGTHTKPKSHRHIAATAARHQALLALRYAIAALDQNPEQRIQDANDDWADTLRWVDTIADDLDIR
jgi:hypothetical protein